MSRKEDTPFERAMGTNSFNYAYYLDEDEAMWEDEQDEVAAIVHQLWKQACIEDEV